MPFPLAVTDARGQRMTLSQPPRRIVSLVPSQTELLAYLGLDEEVVGLTRFCVHPEAWKRRKPIVGGTKQINLESLRALQPDLVLTNLESNANPCLHSECQHALAWGSFFLVQNFVSYRHPPLLFAEPEPRHALPPGFFLPLPPPFPRQHDELHAVFR